MSHPIIDFDVQGNCDMILKVARTPPKERSKPLVAVVRGMGSGKSRCSEEVRRALLKRPGVLPIGITFNAGSGFKNYEKYWGGDSETSFALMVIARCASVLYDIHLGKMCKLIHRKLPSFYISGIDSAGYHLIDMFLRYVVSNERNRGVLIDDVVIIVDELLKAEENLRRYNKKSDDACVVLRAAVLNEKSNPFDFNTAVCISSLDMSVCGDTLSGRSVKSLSIPFGLNPTRIVNEWWKAKKDEERILLYVAACVNTLPRVTETVEKYLTKHSDRSIDQKFIQELFLDLRNVLTIRYAWKQFPDENLLYSIIFGKKIYLDDTVQRYIISSILLNSVETCSPKVDEIVPISSLTVLAGIKDVIEKNIMKWTKEVYEDAVQEIVNLAENGAAERIPFESFFANWMRYRWLIARAADKKVTLAELLGIQEEIALPEAEVFNKALNVEATTSFLNRGDFDTLKVDSNKDAAEHLQELEGIKVDANHPIAVRRGAKDDKFNLLIIIYQGEGVLPLRFYIYDKSLFHENPVSVDIYDDLSKKLSQYEDVKLMCDEAHVPFIYCYLTHHPGSLSMRGNRCLILREKESKHFFGPMRPLCIGCQSTF